MQVIQSFFSFIVCTLLIMISGSAMALQDELLQAFNAGQPDLNIRIRYENVDQDNALKKAQGFTVRTRLGFTTAPLMKTSAHIDINDVRTLIDDFAPENDIYSPISDPADTQLNQAYLYAQPNEALSLKIGRQRLVINNGRFIGNSGWRQKEQTFDAVTALYEVDSLQLTMAYIKQVNGVTETFDANDADNIVANISYQMTDQAQFSAYHYGIDQTSAIETKIDTTGLRITGQSGDQLQFLYAVDYASQKNHLKNNIAEYKFLSLGFGYEAIELLANYEVLGTDDGLYGFQTPLASKHGFNGWADVWSETPNQGLEDLSVQLSTQVWLTTWILAVHDYSSNQSGDDFGSEINLSAIKSFKDRYILGFKYATYNSANNIRVDTEKVWFWGEIKF